MRGSADDVRAWLDEVWDRTEAALILRGGDDAGPLGRRPVPAEIYDDDALAELRVLTTTGDFRGDICRFRNNLTVADPVGLLGFLERHVAHPLKPPPVGYIGFRGE